MHKIDAVQKRLNRILCKKIKYYDIVYCCIHGVKILSQQRKEKDQVDVCTYPYKTSCRVYTVLFNMYVQT